MKFSLALLTTLALVGCTHSDRWQNVSIKTGSSQFDSSKLIYPASNFCQDIELELLNTNQALFAYINVYAQPIPAYEGNPHEALLMLETPTNQYRLVVERLEGGQRLRIPPTSTTLLVNLMNSSSFVTIKLEDGYKTKISTTSFGQHYKKLKSTHPFFRSNDPVGLAL